MIPLFFIDVASGQAANLQQALNDVQDIVLPVLAGFVFIVLMPLFGRFLPGRASPTPPAVATSDPVARAIAAQTNGHPTSAPDSSFSPRPAGPLHPSLDLAGLYAAHGHVRLTAWLTEWRDLFSQTFPVRFGGAAPPYLLEGATRTLAHTGRTLQEGSLRGIISCQPVAGRGGQGEWAPSQITLFFEALAYQEREGASEAVVVREVWSVISREDTWVVRQIRAFPPLPVSSLLGHTGPGPLADTPPQRPLTSEQTIAPDILIAMRVLASGDASHDWLRFLSDVSEGIRSVHRAGPEGHKSRFLHRSLAATWHGRFETGLLRQEEMLEVDQVRTARVVMNGEEVLVAVFVDGVDGFGTPQTEVWTLIREQERWVALWFERGWSWAQNKTTSPFLA